jgi:4-hydroxy-tetrahydrodipicolinate synthase
MYLALKQGQFVRAQHLVGVVALLTGALFSGSNRVPVKYALSAMKLMSPGVRLPLVELTDESKAEIDAVLAQVAHGYADYLIADMPDAPLVYASAAAHSETGPAPSPQL